MRTGKPNNAKPGEIYISPESMDVLKSLYRYPPDIDITTGDLPHIRWEYVAKEPLYIDHGTKHSKDKLYYVKGLGWDTKEWAKLFLKNWNRAVELWDNGYLFDKQKGGYWPDQIRGQEEYARICCSWIIPSGMVEPHCVAEGL